MRIVFKEDGMAFEKACPKITAACPNIQGSWSAFLTSLVVSLFNYVKVEIKTVIYNVLVNLKLGVLFVGIIIIPQKIKIKKRKLYVLFLKLYVLFIIRNKLLRIQFMDKNCFFNQTMVIFCIGWFIRQFYLFITII